MPWAGQGRAKKVGFSKILFFLDTFDISDNFGLIFVEYLFFAGGGGGWSDTGKLGMSSRNSFVAVIEDTKVFIRCYRGYHCLFKMLSRTPTISRIL